MDAINGVIPRFRAIGLQGAPASRLGKVDQDVVSIGNTILTAS
jgi:hypothetical protein